MTYRRFIPAHRLSEYRGQSGSEVGGLALSPLALDALATSAGGKEPELAVIGVYERADGARFLDFGVTREYVEAHTDFRDQDGHLRLLCPVCDQWDGKHSKSCKA